MKRVSPLDRFFGRTSQLDDYSLQVLTESLRVLKKTQGSSIRMSHGLSQSDCRFLRKNLGRISKFRRNYSLTFELTDDLLTNSLGDKMSGQFSYSMVIEKR